MIEINRERYGFLIRQLVGCAHSVVMGEKTQNIVGIGRTEITNLRNLIDNSKNTNLVFSAEELRKYIKLSHITLNYLGEEETELIAAIEYDKGVKLLTELENILANEENE